MVLVLGAAIALLSARFAAPPSTHAAPPKDDSVETDYSGELPRIKPVEADKALATFRVQPGFRIEQVACEPVVVDPVAMAFDENGRLFVVEMRGYSEDENLNLGRVRMLVDDDGDGRYERSTVYAEGLSWPTAITCYNGGVFVGAAPDIFYIKDHDGDGRADEQRLVYTGFGRGNVQGLLNTFKWGLDNRIHGATSSSGAQVQTVLPEQDAKADAKENTSEKKAPPLALRGRDFAIEPRTLEISATSGGGQHGLSFDAWGDKFVCSNSNHIQQVMFEDRYLARNPFLAAPSPRVSIAADGPQADVFRTSPVEPWRIVRTRLRKKGIVPGPVEGGGTAAGYFTGATGVTIYRGSDWPSEFYGYAIIGDVGSNLIHRKRLDADGVGFVARRIDEKSEFVSSTDIWFRPVQFANAPDGGLYVADMYREVIEHPKSLHPVIKKHLDLTSGRDRGRIYRIVAEKFKQPPLPQPRLGKASTAELVATLDHANGWHRETAARLLYERQDRSAIVPLEKLAAAGKRPEGRIRSLYALASLEALEPAVVLAALADEHSQVRRHAVRLAEQVADSPEVRQRLFALAGDQDIHVRYQLAFTLGELAGANRNEALAAILRRDGGDRWISLAAFSSLAQGAGAVLTELASDAKFRQTDAGREVLRGLAAQIGKQQRGDDVAALLELLRSLSSRNDQQVLPTIVQGIAAKKGSPLETQIAAATGGKADAVIAGLVKSALVTARSDKQSAAERVQAVQLLRLGNFEQTGDVLAALLGPTQPADVQTTALATLSSYESADVAPLLMRQWPSFSPRVRAQAAEVLFSRQMWIEQLLAAVESQRIPLADLESGRLKLLAAHRDAGIRKRAEKLLAGSASGRRGDVVESYQSVLEMSGDPLRGKAVHKKVCAACHRLQGEGHEIGPNLAAMRNRGPEAILVNVLDPNREVNPQFLNYALITNDGRTISGMIAAETATSVTLRRADNAADTVLRVDIDELKSTGISLMPEGVEKEIDKQAMADLIAYLRSVE